MNEFLQSLATILEVPAVKAEDDLKAFSQWDSLSVLSVIAMVDADYGVNMRAADFEDLKSTEDVWKFIQSKKGL
jgi:acyl carrier protein